MAFTAAVVAVLSAFLWHNRDYIAASYSLESRSFLLVSALAVLTLAVRGLVNRLHFGSLGVSASLLDWFRIVTVTSFANYVPFSAGLVAKAVFLKRVHELPFRRFAVGQTSLVLLVIATNGVTGLVVLAASFPEHLFGVVGAGFAGMASAGGLLVLPERVRASWSSRWLPLATYAGGRALRNWPGVAVGQLCTLLSASLGLQLCFAMGESQVGLAACLVFTAAAVLARAVTIVPGALGVRELLIGGLALLTGFDPRDAVVASTLARAAEIAVVFALGGVFIGSLSGEVAASYANAPTEDRDEAERPAKPDGS